MSFVRFYGGHAWSAALCLFRDTRPRPFAVVAFFDSAFRDRCDTAFPPLARSRAYPTPASTVTSTFRCGWVIFRTSPSDTVLLGLGLLPFDVDWPQLPLRVLSATAPLEQVLAQQVSDTLHARVFEVFGSTETASIASRETLAGDAWTLYDDNYLLCEESLSVCEVNIEPLAESHPLHDQFELIPGQPNRFRLLGRRSDVVKVAGKRSSLAYLNQKLQAIDGVSDGLFWQAPNGERLQAFVVSDLNAHDIKQALAQDMDAVFLPRPIHFVEQIPRNELGKIQFQQLSDLAKQNATQTGTESPNVRA